MPSKEEIQAFHEITPSLLRTYAEVVSGVVPEESWNETWFALVSLKGHLQSFPDFVEQNIWAAPSLDGKNIRVTALTIWRSLDAAEVWISDGWSVERLLLAMKPPAYNVQAYLQEEVS